MLKIYLLGDSQTDLSYEFNTEEIYVGRSSENDVQIKDRTVSRRHLKIINRLGRFYIKDLKSNNGTFVNGKRIRPEYELEVKQGIPIIVGLNVICLGKGCQDFVHPVQKFIDSYKTEE